MTIKKSDGYTPTEKTLVDLCDRTFLKAWSYPNPYKKQADELCDLIAVFDGHVFIFQDKEIKFNNEKDIQTAWNRWKKKAFDEALTQVHRAAKWVAKHPDKIYLDPRCETLFPINLSKQNYTIHRIIVAHGAKHACKDFSDENIYGSLAISYGKDNSPPETLPFMLHLQKEEIVHVFDSQNFEIILNELDTFYDFVTYLTTKEQAITKYDALVYCGEEDLLAHYLMNFSETEKRHIIGTLEKDYNMVSIGEGDWKYFISTPAYMERKKANEGSYFWDELIQLTCENALDGKLLGDSDIFNGNSAIHEMAKEPRFIRRALSEKILDAIRDFPEDIPGFARNLSLMPSYEEGKAYIFMQVKYSSEDEYDDRHREKRKMLLEIACGVAKNKFPHFTTIVGIAMDAPKFTNGGSEDLLILDCNEWSEEQKLHYEKANEGLNFFDSDRIKKEIRTVSDFPNSSKKKKKIGRNDPCPCRSGRKYKKCCGA